MASNTRFRPKGTTLIELLIAMTLLVVLSAAAFRFIHGGMEFYRDSVASIEARQQALLFSAKFAAELRDSAMESIRWEPGGPGNRGVAFSSIRNSAGQINVDSSARTLWGSLVCFYIQPLEGTDALYRASEDIGYDTTRPPDPFGETPARDPAYFASLATGSKRVVCRNVRFFEVELLEDVVEFSIETSLSTRYEHALEIRSKSHPRY